MTSSDLPPDPPATTPPATRAQWPSRNQALGLVGAFLLGAFLCGGAGLAIGAVAGNFHSNHGPMQDKRPGIHQRDDPRRRDGNFPPPPIVPRHRPAPPALPPASPPNPAPTATPS